MEVFVKDGFFSRAAMIHNAEDTLHRIFYILIRVVQLTTFCPLQHYLHKERKKNPWTICLKFMVFHSPPSLPITLVFISWFTPASISSLCIAFD